MNSSYMLLPAVALISTLLSGPEGLRAKYCVFVFSLSDHHSSTSIFSVLQDEYQKLRAVVCASADVYLVCFDVTKPATLERVRHHWIPEIREYNSVAPFVLVATKCDERIAAQIEGRSSRDTVSFSQARSAGQELGAITYCECSARNLTGLKKIFEEAAAAGLKKAYPDGMDKKNGCVLA